SDGRWYNSGSIGPSNVLMRRARLSTMTVSGCDTESAPCGPRTSIHSSVVTLTRLLGCGTDVPGSVSDGAEIAYGRPCVSPAQAASRELPWTVLGTGTPSNSSTEGIRSTGWANTEQRAAPRDPGSRSNRGTWVTSG